MLSRGRIACDSVASGHLCLKSESLLAMRLAFCLDMDSLGLLLGKETWVLQVP